MTKKDPNKNSLGAESIMQLHELLMKIPEVSKYSTLDHDEVSTLAHGINDIAESSRKILELTVQLKQAANVSEVEDLLFSFGEELMHIIYHIHDSKFYQHLLPS